MRGGCVLLLCSVFSCTAVPILPEDDSAVDVLTPDANAVIIVSAELEALLSSFVGSTINELRADPCAASETPLSAFKVCC